MSAPIFRNSLQRSIASSRSTQARASVRAMIRMSAPASRASTAAWMRVNASSRPTTDFPSVWPQRFGAT